MSGKDDQETPDTENDNPDSNASGDVKADAIPEVEAEIVDADEIAKASDAVEAAPDTIDAVVEEVVHEDDIAPAPKSGVSPGIILVGLLALFGGGLLVNQFVGGGDDKSAVETASEEGSDTGTDSGTGTEALESVSDAASEKSAQISEGVKDVTNEIADATEGAKAIDLSSSEEIAVDARAGEIASATDDGVEAAQQASVDASEVTESVDPRAAILALQEQAALKRDAMAADGSEAEATPAEATATEATATEVAAGEVEGSETETSTAVVADAADGIVETAEAAAIAGEVVDATEAGEPVAGEAVIADAVEAGEAKVENVSGAIVAGADEASTTTEAVIENAEESTEAVVADASENDPVEANPVEGEATVDETQRDGVTVAAVAPAVPGKIVNEFAELKEVVQQRTAALDEALNEGRVASEQQAAELAALRSDLSTALEERDRRSNEDIAELRDRIEKIQTGGLPAGRQAMAALALNALQKKVSTGDTYAEELNVLARLAPDAPVIGAVRPFATTGVPTVAALSEEFDDVRRDAMAAYKLNEAKGPLGKMMANLSNLVSVRPANPQQGEDPVAVISRIEGNLRDENLVGAMGELDQLPEDLLSSFSEWQSKAEATKNAIVAIDEMNSALLNQFGEPNDG